MNYNFNIDWSDPEQVQQFYSGIGFNGGQQSNAREPNIQSDYAGKPLQAPSGTRYDDLATNMAFGNSVGWDQFFPQGFQPQLNYSLYNDFQGGQPPPAAPSGPPPQNSGSGINWSEFVSKGVDRGQELAGQFAGQFANNAPPPASQQPPAYQHPQEMTQGYLNEIVASGPELRSQAVDQTFIDALPGQREAIPQHAPQGFVPRAAESPVAFGTPDPGEEFIRNGRFKTASEAMRAALAQGIHIGFADLRNAEAKGYFR